MTRKTTINTKDNSLENYHRLSIQVSLNGLSFCILDTIGNSVLDSGRVSFKKSLTPYEVEKHLKDLLEKHHIPSKQFISVVVVHSNGIFSFVPEPLFDENELANYLKLNTKILVNDHIAFDALNNLEMVNVYVPFMNINNYIFELFGEFEYKHCGTVLVAAMLNQPVKGKGPLCYVHASENQMDIIVVEQKKLLFYNSFVFQTKEDFIYYILFTLEQLKLAPESIPIKLFGAIEEGDELFNICYTYIKDISIFAPLNYANGLEVSTDKNIEFTLLSAL